MAGLDSAELPWLPTAQLHIFRKPTSPAPQVHIRSSFLSAPAKGRQEQRLTLVIPTGKGGTGCVLTNTTPSRVSTNANSETTHGSGESHRLGKEHKYTASYIT